MERLKLDLWTFDVGVESASPAEFADLVTQRVLESWEQGADVVVFPEFTWMGLERFIEGPDKLAGVAALFWGKLWPGIREKLDRSDKAVVLGTVPFLGDDGLLKNRAPILSGGRVLHQDKIHLTPWENAFSGGGPLRTWSFRGHKLAVVICLDVEIPELSVALRGSGLDLLLVPSATENELGVGRIGRCASARAVELGCYVGVCHLVGRTESELIDENVGQLVLFAPSQSRFRGFDHRDERVLHHEGFHCRSWILDMKAIVKSRALRAETDPSKIRPGIILVESV
ncbi:MAG: nitrilase-related carbon-nitrogen hydrolase [Verrucomicrobiaceae bacterium]